MAGNKIGIGIIGANANYGWSKRAHLPALKALPEYELAAVCTSRPETAQESKEFYGAGAAFHDYREMVQHPGVDLVVVSVKVPFHYEMVKAAIEAGKDVFCEWPLGANLAEAEELTALAQEKGVGTMIGLQSRGDPAVIHIKELLADGCVGEPLLCNMTMFLPGLLQRGRDRAWSADRKAGANTLTIATGHSLDMLGYCVGEFLELSAHVAVQVPVWTTTEGDKVDCDAPDNVLVNGRLDNCAVASVHVSTVPWHGTGWRLEVFGNEGTLTASGGQMVQYTDIKIHVGRHDGSMEAMTPPDKHRWAPSDTPAGEAYNVAQLYRRYSQAKQAGEGVDNDFNLAVKRHRLLDAFQESSDKGAWVKVEA